MPTTTLNQSDYQVLFALVDTQQPPVSINLEPTTLTDAVKAQQALGWITAGPAIPIDIRSRTEPVGKWIYMTQTMVKQTSEFPTA
jgi:hypothetical protein